MSLLGWVVGAMVLDEVGRQQDEIEDRHAKLSHAAAAQTAAQLGDLFGVHVDLSL